MSSHDRSAALLEDGKLWGAIAEERLDRRKRSEGLIPGQRTASVLAPMQAITALLRDRGVHLSDLDLVVCGRSVTSARGSLTAQLPLDPAKVVEPSMPAHHIAHAYSAYATSPFSSPAVLVVDEQGSHVDGYYERISWYQARNGSLMPLDCFNGSVGQLSLGMFFDVVAGLVGLAEAGLPAAGKLMALAAFAPPPAGWSDPLTLDREGDAYIDASVLDSILTDAGHPIRATWTHDAVKDAEDFRHKFQAIHWDTPLAKTLASWAQDALSRGVRHTASLLRHRSEADELAYAGGVALNCAATSSLRAAGWRDVFVHSAATDDGCAVGLAMYGWAETLGNTVSPTPEPFDPCLGPRRTASEAVDALETFGLRHLAEPATAQGVARLVHEGAVVCRASGRSEWGPRALGNRSILVDPTREGVVDWLNSRVKFREPFRPFGVCVLREAAADLLVLEDALESLGPYMIAVAPVRGSSLAGVSHADGTVRYQIVDDVHQPEMAEVVREFGRLSGVSAVLNTSFNTMGEPLVETYHDAVRQFVQSGADALVVGNLTVDLRSMDDARLSKLREGLEPSPSDLLRIALSVEAAGYPEAARRAFAALAATGEMSRMGLQAQAFAMRAAKNTGELATAQRIAEEILAQSSWPPSAIEAVRVLAGIDALGPRVAAFLEQAASGRGAMSIASLLSKPPDNDGAPH